MSADLDKACADFRHFTLEEEDKWKPIKEANGVKVHSRPSEGSSLNISRGVVKVKAPLQKCLDLAMDPDRRTTWDNVCKESRKISEPGENRVLVYMQSQAKWPAAARDFIIDMYVKKYEDGSVVAYGKSPEKDDVPQVKNIVRGKCMNSGYIFVPNADDTETTVTFVMQLDLCGSIPNFLVNMAMVDEPLCLARFRDAVEGSLKK